MSKPETLRAVLNGPPIDVLPPVVIPIKPARKEPLAEVELLLLFSPVLQSGGPKPIHGVPVNCTQQWVTAQVFGNPGVSELTGLPILEDLDIRAQGRDISPLLDEKTVRDIEKYVLEVV